MMILPVLLYDWTDPEQNLKSRLEPEDYTCRSVKMGMMISSGSMINLAAMV